VKRVVLFVLGVYLLAALLTRAAEAKGVHSECGCHSERDGFRTVVHEDAVVGSGS
jgi:hypothetical protein